MSTSLILQGLLLLTGTCPRLYGAPTHLPNFNHRQDDSCEGHCPSLVTTAVLTRTTESVLLDEEHVTGSVLTVGAAAGGGGGGGGTGPHGGPQRIDSVMQTGNGDSLHGRFRASEPGGEAQSQRREGKQIDSTEEEEEEDVKRKNKKKPIEDESFSPVGGEQMDPERRTKLSFSDSDPYAPLWTQRLSSSSPIASLMFVTPQTSTPLTVWRRDGATVSSPSDPILPEIGPNMMSRDDLESLWTEAVRPAGVDVVDDATEATMSSEALPLIFEPFEDVTAKGQAEAAPEAIARVPVGAQSPVSAATRRLGQLVAVEDDGDGPSHGPSALLPDWTSPWQTSGSELLEPVGSLGPPASQRRVQTEPEETWPGKAAARASNFEENVPSAGPSLSSLQQAMTTVTLATHQLLHKSRLGLEEMDSDEEPVEEEDEENSEESVEEESEEDLTETTKASSTQPPYSLIPPLPVWVQRNQGLMRSWLELIREKAGYVSGMLAPVGIGITGALLIVGALYSIRMIHRKRRNSFKRQRRKARQPEQPREPGTSCQDQTMLLADSSEDEF